MNKIYEDLIASAAHEYVMETARRYFSMLCFENNAYSENSAYKLNLDVEGTSGLSTLQSLKYISIFEDYEGIIWISEGTNGDDMEWKEMDDYPTDSLLYIVANSKCSN